MVPKHIVFLTDPAHHYQC